MKHNSTLKNLRVLLFMTAVGLQNATHAALLGGADSKVNTILSAITTFLSSIGLLVCTLSIAIIAIQTMILKRPPTEKLFYVIGGGIMLVAASELGALFMSPSSGGVI